MESMKLLNSTASVHPFDIVCDKNFRLGHIFSSINGKVFVFGMHDPCGKTFSCCDIDL